MNFVWEDYDNKKHKVIDEWITMSYSFNNDEINKFALFNEPLSEVASWYESDSNNMGSLKDYVKVVLKDDQIVAFIILNLYEENGKIVASINPIALNPQLVSKGLGTEILQELIHSHEKILGRKVDMFYAGIDEKNEKSKKLFTNAKFILKGLHEDKTFGDYYLEV